MNRQKRWFSWVIRTILLGELPGVPINKTSGTTAVIGWMVMERSHGIPGSMIEDYLFMTKYKSDWILQILFHYFCFVFFLFAPQHYKYVPHLQHFFNNPDRFVFARGYPDHRETQGLSL